MSPAISNTRHQTVAILLRTVALFVLLWQVRLIASDVADTSFFAASLIGALVVALFLNGFKYKGRPVGPVEAIVIITLAPYVIRFFVAAPRWFSPGVSDAAILLDSLLLNLDRNYFSALIPFYWVAISTCLSLRYRVFLRMGIIVEDTFFLVLFSIKASASMDAYRWPILMIGLFVFVFFLQVLAMVFSMPPELKLQRKEKVFASVFIFLLVFAGGALFIRPFQERAVEKGGGLLEPNLFRFDFSRILRLESEISMNDDLVLIVKKDPYDYHSLLRRYTLSGYSPKQGFFRLDDVDEAAHPQRLPGRRSLLPFKGIDEFRISEQEYYLVNFDASAFIGMNMPVEIIPFETWDASSFNSAYSVISHTSEALPFELLSSVTEAPGPGSLGLSPEEYALYTDYGGDDAIAVFAREIIRSPSPRLGRRGTESLNTESPPSYWEQVQMVYDRLKFGEYRYSLKPGIASDGDQLKHFLFTAKKGYCSYYAFAFTLLLRSLGIPCRVAAGFFVDPSTEAFNYYPVRTDMAHAWAEVWYPGYGWIEYDPTSTAMAEGEEFRFSQGTPPELFERLMKEILDNRSQLKLKDEGEAETGRTNLATLGRTTLRFLTRSGPFLAIAALALLFLTLRSGFLWLYLVRRSPRKKALCLWAHTKRRLSLAGLGRLAQHAALSSGEVFGVRSAEAEWAKAADSITDGVYQLYLDAAAARFAPRFAIEDCLSMAEHYRLFNEEYLRAIPLRRRLLAWLLPPLTLALRLSSTAKTATKTLSVVLLLLFLFSLRGAQAQDDSGAAQDDSRAADTIYENAMAAQFAENWERAVELFSQGTSSYPDDFRFPWSLGNLYYQRKLYHLAWDEFRRAEGIAFKDGVSTESSEISADLLTQLANTAGYLNRNALSADYFRMVLLFEPDNREAVGSLTWMYFKLHRFEEGERLLLDAIERLGEDMDFAMTLGTIYSGLFRYGESKAAYQRAIKGAEAVGEKLFVALSNYNLSILESRFYKYDLAFDCTNASLEAMDRASGRLARGELYMARMELSRALADYQDAYGMDSSPLSKLSLAEVLEAGGRLSDAALYANDCLKAKNDSWMLNYGIDPARYKRDIHEILKNTYKGLFNAEKFFIPDYGSGNNPGALIKEWAQSFLRRVSYRFLFALHSHLFRKYSLLSADAYDLNYNLVNPEAMIQYSRAFDPYPRRAIAYLNRARDFEAPLIPESVPSYNFEEGRLRKDRGILAETLWEFDPLWERDKIAKVYAELATSGKKAERQDAAERLFAINKGALLRNGIKLPAVLQISGELIHMEGFLKKASMEAGFEKTLLDSSRFSPRFALIFSSGETGYVSVELYDNGRGISVWKQSQLLPSAVHRSAHQRAALARTLRDGIFDGF